jgi:MFS family permease
MNGRPQRSPIAYRWFVGGISSWFLAWGMNAVVFSWLVVEVLDAPAAAVGVAQSAMMAPSLLLLLFGGAIADRRDPRGFIAALHALAVLPILGLLAVLRADALALSWLVGYGLALGAINAFVMPARDALLARVAGPDLMRAVAGMTIAQFGGQAAGNLVAGSTEIIGITSVLVAQAAILVIGALATLRIPRAAPSAPRERPSALRQIAVGLRTVAARPTLRVPVMLVTAVGLLFIGPYMVTFPLLVRDFYEGGSFMFAWVLMTFPIGAITGSLVIRAAGGLRHKGVAILLALGLGGANLIFLGSGLSFPAFFAGALFWGLMGSAFINASRTLVQEEAPPDQRGRVLSVYQLGFIGGGPLGAATAGLVAGSVGPLMTLRIFGAGMLLLVAAATVFSSARHMR